MQPLQHCIGPTIRIGREILCLPYAGFFCTGLGHSKFRRTSNGIIGSKDTKVLVNGAMGVFCLLVELHRKGSVPAACAAGLLYY